MEIIYDYGGKRYKAIIDKALVKGKKIIKVAFWHGHNEPTLVEYLDLREKKVTYETIRNSFDYRYVSINFDNNKKVDIKVSIEKLKRTFTKKILPIILTLLVNRAIEIHKLNVDLEHIMNILNYVLPFEIGYKVEDDKIIIENKLIETKKVRRIKFNWQTAEFKGIKIPQPLVKLEKLEKLTMDEIRTFLSLIYSIFELSRQKKNKGKSIDELIDSYLENINLKYITKRKLIGHNVDPWEIRKFLELIDKKSFEYLISEIKK